MSGIHLTSPVQRGTDSDVDIEFIGINYKQGRVLIRLIYAQTGESEDVVIGQGGIESIAALVGAVPKFAGLRVDLLAHLQNLIPGLGSGVT